MSQSANTIGKYQIIREIARSNDIVYEAYDPEMNRRLALKELNLPNNATDEQKQERIKRFHREAKAAGMLTHPNIVTIYDVGEADGRHYIAMEYLEGESLRTRIDRSYLSIDEAIPVFKQVLEALRFSHHHNVVHRDIKPDNIHLLPDGRVKLTDFGIARLTFEPSITIDGQIFGTPSYMSPEQVLGKEIDHRTDLFSLAVVMYECLTGTKPFFGDSVVTITYNIVNSEPAPPPGVPFPVEQIIRRGMDKSPNNRYQSTDQMLQDLLIAEQQMKQGFSAPPPQYSNAPTPGVPGTSYPTAPPIPVGGSQQHSGYPPSGTGFPNPYQQQTPTSGHYHRAPGYFFPSPPKPPMLSASARQLLGQIIGTLLIAFAVCGLIVVIIWGIIQAYNRSHSSIPQNLQPFSNTNRRPNSNPYGVSDESANNNQGNSNSNKTASESASTELAFPSNKEYSDPEVRELITQIENTPQTVLDDAQNRMLMGVTNWDAALEDVKKIGKLTRFDVARFEGARSSVDDARWRFGMIRAYTKEAVFRQNAETFERNCIQWLEQNTVENLQKQFPP